MAFIARSGLEAAKEMLRRYLTERDTEGTLELVADDIVWFGTSSFERAFGKDQLRRLITDEIAQDSTPMDAIYKDAHVSDTSSVRGASTVALLANVVKRDESGSSLFIRVVFGCMETPSGWKIVSANTTVPTDLQREGEFFPVTFAEEKQKLLRNQIIETTIAALESQDIYAWEYDIVHDVFIYTEKIRKKFGIPNGADDMPERVLERGVVLPQSASEYRRVFSEISSGAKDAAAEIRCRDVMGVESHYRLKVISVFDDAGKPLRAVCCVKDMTDMLARERERNEMLAAALRSAEAANSAKTEFLSRISHEIRTPMNAIAGMTAIARDAGGNAAKIDDCLGKIELSSKFMLSLVNDMLEISRSSGGKNLLREEPADLRGLIGSLNAYYYPQAEAKGLSYHCSAAPDLPEKIICDAAKLRQVLSNLLSNAVKFTDKGGSVNFEIKRQNVRAGRTGLEFCITDNGRGISEEFMPRLWDPFAQEDDGSYLEYAGAGLGLPVARNLVEMMDGSISVNSIKGLGSKFTVALNFAASENDDGGQLNGNQNIKVLIAEKDRVVRQCAAAMLEALKMTPVCAGSCSEALAAAAGPGKHCSAVLASVETLAGDPAGQIAALKKKFPGAPFVLLTEGEETQELKAITSAVLRKPLVKDALAAVLSRLLKKDAQSAQPGAAAATLKDKRLLLVEDQPTNAEVAKAILKKAGCRVETAANGLLALEKFARAPEAWYDAILMDLRMPVMDGLEATRNIRALQKSDAAIVPIIALTAQALEIDAEKCAAAGMNGHVAKPIDPDELLAVIEKAVGVSRKR